MHKTKSPKSHSPTYSTSLFPNSYPQLAYRPFGSQLQKSSVAPKTQTEVENVAFAQQHQETTGLSVQAKYGTITPEGQERLTVLQAQMDGLLNSQLSHATRFGHNIANIPLRRPDTSTTIQSKLTIGEPGDKYEQEADETARQVVQRIHQSKGEKVQRESLPEEDELQMKPESSIQRESLPKEDELQMKPMVQRVADRGRATSPDLETSIQQVRGSGQPLADSIKSPMEQAFGADFSGVKVHTDTQADQLNQSIQAKAFTTGQDVFFGSGTYEPGSRRGQELLAHELTHVVQQRGKRHSPLQRVNVNEPTQENTEKGNKQEVSGVKRKKFAESAVLEYIKLTQNETIKNISGDIDGGVCMALVTIISMFVQFIQEDKLDLKTLEKALLNYIIDQKGEIFNMQTDLGERKGAERKIKDKISKVIDEIMKYNNIADLLEKQEEKINNSSLDKKAIQADLQKIEPFKKQVLAVLDNLEIEENKLNQELAEEQSRTGYESPEKIQEEYIGKTELVYENNTEEEIKENDLTDALMPKKSGTVGYLIMIPGHMVYALCNQSIIEKEQYITYDPNEGFVQLSTYNQWIKQIISLIEDECGNKHSGVKIKKVNRTIGKKIRKEWLKKVYGLQ